MRLCSYKANVNVALFRSWSPVPAMVIIMRIVIMEIVVIVAI